MNILFKRSFFIIALLIVITISSVGCGGGGHSHKPPVYTTGSVSGKVDFADPQPASLKSDNIFPVVQLHQNRSFSATAATNEKIVHFREGLSISEVSSIVQGMGGRIKYKIYGPKNLYVIAIDTTRFATASISGNPDIVSMEDNIRLYACDAPDNPNDQYYQQGQFWSYSMLALPEAWEIIPQPNNKQVIVAVIDTGVAVDHPDLKDNLLPGWNFVDNLVDGKPVGNNDPSDTTYYDENNRFSHGTHVAGIIDAITDNGIGVAGVCWKLSGVKILPVRVLGPDGSGTVAQVIAGIYYAIENHANVINLSMASDGSIYYGQDGQTLRNAIDAAVAQNITIVAAAGNNNGPVCFPASYSQKVIAVGALGPDGTKASYSNYGPEIFVSAPGGVPASDVTSAPGRMILSTTYDKASNLSTDPNTYCFMAGTSMACPYITGLVAMMYAMGFDTPEKVRSRLQQYAIDKGTYGKDDYYGYGIPDAYAMISGQAIYKKEVQVVVVNADKTIETIQNPDSSGMYTINGLQPGSKYIGVFLDHDMNGVVNNEDRFAVISGISVEAGKVTNVNTIVLSPLKDLSGSMSLQDYLNTPGVLN